MNRQPTFQENDVVRCVAPSAAAVSSKNYERMEQCGDLFTFRNNADNGDQVCYSCRAKSYTMRHYAHRQGAGESYDTHLKTNYRDWVALSKPKISWKQYQLNSHIERRKSHASRTLSATSTVNFQPDEGESAIMQSLQRLEESELPSDAWQICSRTALPDEKRSSLSLEQLKDYIELIESQSSHLETTRFLGRSELTIQQLETYLGISETSYCASSTAAER